MLCCGRVVREGSTRRDVPVPRRCREREQQYNLLLAAVSFPRSGKSIERKRRRLDASRNVASSLYSTCHRVLCGG
jgi:hypothetical protein